MRLIGRPNKPEDPSTKTAEIVLQVGKNKIQLPADRFPVDDETLRPANASEPTSEDQDRAISTLMHMRQTLQQQSATGGSGQGFPFSPDDFLPTHQRASSAQDTNNNNNNTLTAPQFPPAWDRRPSNNLPEPYDPDHQPATFCPAVPKPDIMPLRNKPTIFDTLGETPRQRPPPPVEPRKRDSVNEKRSRRIRKHLFPDRSPSTLNAKSRPGTGLTSSTSSGGNARRMHDFGDDVVKATKTNVRRPPKGIQNWFDGFISSDDDEEEEDEEDEPQLGPPTSRRVAGPAQPLPPQELPADDVPPPAYSNLVRGGSSASRWSNRSYTPGDDNPPPFTHGDEKAPMDRTESVSTTAGSLRSSPSQNRRQNSDSRLSRSKLASESVLALSDQSASEQEPDEHHHITEMRDSMDEEERSIRFEAAARIHMQRYPLPNQSHKNRTYSSDDVTSVLRGSMAQSSAGSEQIYPGRHQHYRLESRTSDPLDPTAMAMRRLQNSNNAESRVSTSSSNRTFEMENRTLLATDSISNVPSDASHMMVVTDEERALLDMMRRKRAAMAQMSFTEGYHHALRREHASPMRRSASADSLAQEILDQREHPATVTSHEIMRKKLSALQKQDVDEALKMQRFLGIQSRTAEEDFAWPRDSMMPSTLPTSQPRNGSHVSESYAPTNPERDSAYQTWSPHSEGFGFDDQSKLAQYAMSGTMPPLSIAPQMARRVSSQHDIVSSPVPEEEPIPDASDEEDTGRGRQEDDANKHGKRMSRSVDASPVLRTTGLAFRSATYDASSPTSVGFSPSTTSPLSSIIAASLGDKNRRHAGGETPDTDVSSNAFRSKRPPKRTTLPHIPPPHETTIDPRSSVVSMTSITSAGEDVLAAWKDLGGGSDCLQSKRRPPTATPQPQ